MFSPSEYKIDKVYASLHADFKIEDYRELNKYLEIDLYHHPDVSIHTRKPYTTQRIITMIPGTEKSSANMNPVVKPPIEKNEGAQVIKNYFNYRPVIGSLNLLTIQLAPGRNSRFVNTHDSALIPSYHKINRLHSS